MKNKTLPRGIKCFRLSGGISTPRSASADHQDAAVAFANMQKCLPHNASFFSWWKAMLHKHHMKKYSKYVYLFLEIVKFGSKKKTA